MAERTTYPRHVRSTTMDGASSAIAADSRIKTYAQCAQLGSGHNGCNLNSDNRTACNRASRCFGGAASMGTAQTKNYSSVGGSATRSYIVGLYAVLVACFRSSRAVDVEISSSASC